MRKFAFIVFALVGSLLQAQETKHVELSDIWQKYQFFDRGVNGLQSTADGLHYTALKTTKAGIALLKYDYSTGDMVETLVQTLDFQAAAGAQTDIEDYQFSADEKQILIATGVEQIYRHSTKAFFWLYNIETKEFTQLSTEKVRYATFSPDGSKVAYVQDNDLYFYTIATGNTTRITTDGERNKIINGANDWVYEEEFAFDRSFFWSPNSTHIAYYRFDESEVSEFSMDVFGTDLYPSQDVFKYPKAGEANSKVTAHLYNTETLLSNPVLANETYEYIPRVKWTNSNKAVVYTLNRHQNELKLFTVDPNTFETKLLISESDEAYVDINDDLKFLNDDSFIWSSEKDGYNHLYHYSSNGKLKRQITKGQWEVTEFYGIDEKSGTLYFQAAKNHPSEREVYSVSLKGKQLKSISTEKGTSSAEFSCGFKYYTLIHSAWNSPKKVSLHSIDGNEVRVLQNNEYLRNTLADYQISAKEFFTFKAENGQDLNAWMIKPSDFDPNKKYPVLMFVYGGPGAQTVLNSYDGANFMWYQVLADKGYIIMSVDNRGTGARGRDFKKCTYLQLGKYEVEDQIASAQWLAKQSYVDGSRIGIWGWSYGGYMSSNCITQGADVFKAAIAVAPVTNWRFYDSIYTERYMRTPKENADGYDANSPLSHVNKLKGAYLLVHGSADDNVHYQNTMRIVEAFVQANKQFDLFIYPDKNHGIYGGNTRNHLYEKMTQFIVENL